MSILLSGKATSGFYDLNILRHTKNPMTDPWDGYINLLVYHQNQPNGGKYAIHGSQGIAYTHMYIYIYVYMSYGQHLGHGERTS